LLIFSHHPQLLVEVELDRFRFEQLIQQRLGY
jgi:hypothetical protein